jgi:hypothetical protein
MHQHGGCYDFSSVLRQLIPASFLLALTGLTSLPLAVKAAAQPATEAEMTLYTRITSLNACIATSTGVEFNKAIGIAVNTCAFHICKF